MAEERILNVGYPTLDQVREWGYDDDLLLIEQDEDLLLHDLEYVPVLLDLAADDNCPKQEYVAGIVTHYSQFALLHRHIALAEGFARHARSTSHASAPLVERWREWYLWLYDRLIEPRPLTVEEQDRAAWLLLVGDWCSREFKRTGHLVKGSVEYMASTVSFRLYLYVDMLTGIWQSSHDPLT